MSGMVTDKARSSWKNNIPANRGKMSDLTVCTCAVYKQWSRVT